MSHISERLVVHCPDLEASRHVAAFVAKHRDLDGAMRVKLRLPERLFTERRSLGERCVVATLYSLHSTRDPHPTYSVSWSPHGGGPFPEFSGALAVEGDSRDDRFGLIVSGDYAPPLGIAGAQVDTALGWRIAQTSARDLLRSIAEHVEHSFAHSQAAYAGRMPLAHRGDMLPPRPSATGAGLSWRGAR